MHTQKGVFVYECSSNWPKLANSAAEWWMSLAHYQSDKHPVVVYCVTRGFKQQSNRFLLFLFVESPYGAQCFSPKNPTCKIHAFSIYRAELNLWLISAGCSTFKGNLREWLEADGIGRGKTKTFLILCHFSTHKQLSHLIWSVTER